MVTKILMSAIPLLCLMEHMRESLQGLFESVGSGTDVDPRNSFMSRKNSSPGSMLPGFLHIWSKNDHKSQTSKKGLLVESLLFFGV